MDYLAHPRHGVALASAGARALLFEGEAGGLWQELAPCSRDWMSLMRQSACPRHTGHDDLS